VWRRNLFSRGAGAICGQEVIKVQGHEAAQSSDSKFRQSIYTQRNKRMDGVIPELIEQLHITSG